jgi:ABC-type transporter Mla MlaB component
MKRHLTLTTTSQYASGYGQVAAASALDLPVVGTARGPSTRVEPPGWRHTLILTGRLDHRSAAELEDEIDCLRQEGVTALTLDLRGLDEIDSLGTQLVARQRALFGDEGRSFTVIPGGLLRQGLWARARVRNLLANASNEGFVPRFANPQVPGSLRDRSTTMTKHLVPQTAEAA